MASKSGPRIVVDDSLSLYVDVANHKSYDNIEQKKLTTPAVWQSTSLLSPLDSNLWMGVSHGLITPAPSSWSAATAAEQNQWYGITYGDGKWVSVSGTGTNRVQYSIDDGLTWTAASAADQSQWADVAYAPEHIAHPITWTSASATEQNQWKSVTYGNGKFVAISSNGTNRVMYSTDGISWTAATLTEPATTTNYWNTITYADGKYVALAATGTNRAMYSTDGINWTASATAPEANQWTDITYGDGKFVAVSQDGTNRVTYSSDGINWTAASAAEANSWRDVTYGDGKFVAVSFNGTNRVMYSSDGINWTSASVSTDGSWYGITYGGGKFVAVATGKVMYSSDGINWTVLSIDFSGNTSGWQRIIYANGYFVTVAPSGTPAIMYSSDAINWSAGTVAANNDWWGLTYGDGKFVAVSDDGTDRVMYSQSLIPKRFVAVAWTNASGSIADHVMYSSDAITWTSTLATVTGNWGRIIYAAEQNKFYAVAAVASPSNKGMYSYDGINWVSVIIQGTNHPQEWRGLAYDGNSTYVVVSQTGSNILSELRASYSTDGGLTWNGPWDSNMETEDYQWRDVVYGNGKWVAVAQTGAKRVIYSTDPSNALSWTGVTVPLSQWKAIAYGGGYFVAVGYSGGLMYSSDAINWTSVTAPEANDWFGVFYGNNKFIATSADGTNRVMHTSLSLIQRFVAVAEDGPVNTNVVMYSDDGGLSWTESSHVLANTWVDITHGDGKWVAVASQTGSNQVMYSSDGIDWTDVAAAEANSWQAVTYGNGKFVAVAATGTNRVMYSSDGITWSVSGLSGVLENGWRGVGYGNGKFVAVGSSGTNRVMYSSDGISWTAGTTPEQNFYYDVAYGNGKYVAIARGGTNRVMYSSDAITWNAASAPASSTASWWKSIVYGNGKFVAVAHQTGTNRVMYSEDGINWTGASAAEVADWESITYGDGKFVSISDDATNRVMYSGVSTSYIVHDRSGLTTGTYDTDHSVDFVDTNSGYLEFDGIKSKIDFSQSNNYIFGTEDFTISYWLNFNTLTTNDSIIDMRGSSWENVGFSDYIAAGNKWATWRKTTGYPSAADTWYTSSTTLVTNKWYNFVAVRGSGTFKFYINNVLDGSVSFGENLVGDDLIVGWNVSEEAGKLFDGKLSSLMIYKGKALTAAQIDQNYHGIKRRFNL